MSEHLVTCITKSHPEGGHEHITHIGGYGTKAWRITKESAIARIEAKTEAYYTVDSVSGKKAYVGVVRGDGHKAPYLRTYADGQWNNNLLAQTSCPVGYAVVA